MCNYRGARVFQVHSFCSARGRKREHASSSALGGDEKSSGVVSKGQAHISHHTRVPNSILAGRRGGYESRFQHKHCPTRRSCIHAHGPPPADHSFRMFDETGTRLHAELTIVPPRTETRQPIMRCSAAFCLMKEMQLMYPESNSCTRPSRRRARWTCPVLAAPRASSSTYGDPLRMIAGTRSESLKSSVTEYLKEAILSNDKT